MKFNNPQTIIFEDSNGKKETVENIIRLTVTNEYTSMQKKLMSIDAIIKEGDTVSTKYIYMIVRAFDQTGRKIKRKYLKKKNTINSNAYSAVNTFQNKILALFD